MTGILGNGYPPGILGGAIQQAPQTGGLLSLMGGLPQAGPAYGSDAWATQTGGPGAMLWRQVMQAMAGGGNPLAFLDPSKAGKAFSPLTQPFLAPQYQATKGK